mmetsp:Transcript_707/g.1473  ORF Transcript_707/g.1473 Transcript_707/m.1473 type:complete len:91 (+) Transcript_707:140-412(+)
MKIPEFVNSLIETNISLNQNTGPMTIVHVDHALASSKSSREQGKVYEELSTYFQIDELGTCFNAYWLLGLAAERSDSCFSEDAYWDIGDQ